MGLPPLPSLLRFQRCCCCLDLKTGLTIIGVYHVVTSFFLTLGVIFLTVILFGKITDDPSLRTAQNFWICIFCLILCLIMLFKFGMDVLFIYGVRRERAGIIYYYVIVWFGFFVSAIITIILSLFELPVPSASYMVSFMGPGIYTVLLTYSYYEQIIDREEL